MLLLVSVYGLGVYGLGCAQQAPSTPTPATLPSGPAISTELPMIDERLSELIARSAELTRLLLAGEASDAHQYFSPAYHEQITHQAISDLSNDLRKLLGNQVTKIEFLDTEFGAIDPVTQTEALQIRHRVVFDSGKQAITSVKFFLPLDDVRAAAADLAAIDVRETWPSFSPNTLLTAQAALAIFFPGEPPMAAEGKSQMTNQHLGESPGESLATSNAEFLALLHPDMLAQFRLSGLTDIVEQVAQRCGELIETPNWSTWSYQIDGQRLSARGEVVTESDQIELQADFCDEKLIGVTLIGENYAASTLDLLKPNMPLAEKGRLFWEHVFHDQLAAAHELLAPRFQAELPLTEFELAIAQSELLGLSPLQVVEFDRLRFSNRLERFGAVAFTTYYLAKFEDGSQQALQCEFGSDKGLGTLLSFANNFEATLPVADSASVERIVAAFLSQDPKRVKQLLDASGRKVFVAEIASLFMRELVEVFDNQPPAMRDTRVLHQYRAANRQEYLQARLESAGRSILFTAVTQAGELKSFNFFAPELQTFMRAATNVDSLERNGQEFLQQWMKASQTELATEHMVAQADRSELLQQLSTQRDELLAKCGHFLWSDLISWKVNENSNDIHAVYELEFADKTLNMELFFEVSAIGARIGSASLLSPVP